MTESPRSATGKVRVLGIDPGTRVLGYGVLDAERGGAPELVDCGVVRLPTSPLCERLETIFRRVEAVIAQHRPRVLAIEEVFHGKNFQSVLKVGEARGVVVLAAQMAGLEIHEYSPARIKKAATGNGNADKSQVQSMMARLLGIDEPPEPLDITDALAAAFCHCQRRWRLFPESRSKSSVRISATQRRGIEPAVKRRPAVGRRSVDKEPVVATRAEGPLDGAGTRPAPAGRQRSARRRSGGDVSLEALLRAGKARVIAKGKFRPRGASGEKRKGR